MAGFDSSAIDDAFANERGATLAQALFGVVDSVAVASHLADVAAGVTGSTIARFLYCELSVGAAFGAELRDGMRIALKVHGRSRDLAYVQSSTAVQAHLAAAGFPAPQPLCDPQVDAQTVVTVEQYATGELADAHEPAVRGAMARAFADLVRMACAAPAAASLPRGLRPARGVWPPPPNAQFDFTNADATTAWIDDIGRSCRLLIDSHDAPLVTGHCDWAVKNLRFDASGEIAVVYDWDSLYRATEAEFVGVAAATFPATWYLDVVRTPSLAELAAFVDEYEQARGAAFTEAERLVVSAAATYWIAYNARCEHALDPHGERLPDNRRLLASLGPTGLVPLAAPRPAGRHAAA